MPDKEYLDYDGLTLYDATLKSDASPVMNGTAAAGTSKKLSRSDHVHPTDTSRAPTSHASSGTTYGKGTSSNYGHVKLSDATDGTSAAASGGTAATPKAVADALAAAKSYADDIVAGGGGEVNQNAFSNVKVGSTTVAADTKTDTIEFVGSNVTLTPDATNDKVTFGVTASNVTTALGNTPVARATADASGNDIATTYATKSEITNIMTYKGTVAAEGNLPSSGQTTGDTYNITAASTYGPAGTNVSWNGSSWDALGGSFTIASITNAEIAALFT